MNFLHLKYAVEVAKTHSITKAAENLFMGQPNLSRAIRDLEETLGITIFVRTSKGAVPTKQGEEFLEYAKNIISQMDQIENIYRSPSHEIQRLSVSAPESHYITKAFAEVAASLDFSKEIEFDLTKSNNSLKTMDNVQTNGYRLGIIRYSSINSKYYEDLLAERLLDFSILREYSLVLVLSQPHPLSKKTDIKYSDLQYYPEIVCSAYQCTACYDAKRATCCADEGIHKKISVSDTAESIDILRTMPMGYMWCGYEFKEELIKGGFTVINTLIAKKMKDVLIFNKGYKFNDIDKIFTNNLTKEFSI